MIYKNFMENRKKSIKREKKKQMKWKECLLSIQLIQLLYINKQMDFLN